MARARVVRLEIDQAAMEAFLHGDNGPVVRWVHDKAEQVRNAAIRYSPRDTGLLAASIQLAISHHGDRVTGTIGSTLEYALYVHEGTGIYGPKRKRIKPVRAKALRFQPKDGAGPYRVGEKASSPEQRGFVFAKSVKGSPPNPFLVRALEEVMPGLVVRNPLR